MRLIDADELITAFPCGESVRTESVRATINNMPTIEVSEDCISKHDIWKIIEDNAYWVRYNENSTEKGMTLTGINQALNECPPVIPTVSEDCISREQFREQMYHRCFEVDNDPNMQKWEGGNWLRWKLFKEELENAPSVVPSRAEGEWAVKANGNNECSICGREKQNGWVNFCGFCGAKMKGVDE